MNKNRILLVACVLATVAFLATACKKNEEKASCLATTSALQADDEDRVYIDFSDRNTMKWNGGDAIMVYNVNYERPNRTQVAEWTTGPEAEGQTTACFEGPCVGSLQGDNDFFFFVYPSKMFSESVDNTNRLTMTVGDTQHYTELTTASGAHISTIQPGTMWQLSFSWDKDFNMMNWFGVARIYLVGNKEVAKIELEDSQVPLTGSVKWAIPRLDCATYLAYVQAYKNGAISYEDMAEYLSDQFMFEPISTGNVVTLDCKYSYNGEAHNGVQLTNPDTKSFFIVLHPGALSKGFTVRVYFTDHTGVTIDQYANTDYLANPRKFCIVPNRIQAIHFRDANGFDIPVEEFPAFTW